MNIPEHDPQVGHPWSSSSFSPSSERFPSWWAATPSKTEIRSIVRPSRVFPAFIGPPETKIVGMLHRIAAISMPGTILSQLGMQIMPSKQCAFSIVSTESAMISRDGRE